MSTERAAGPLHGLRAGELEGDEQVLHYWRTHQGRGVLTNQRLFLLGHPAPIHRPILWHVDLKSLTDLEVIEPSFPQAYGLRTQLIGGNSVVVSAAGHAGAVSYDALFLVRANDVVVFSGGPDRAAQVQRWIDESRVARMVAVGGNVAPPSGPVRS